MFAERMNNKGNHHQGYNNDYSWGGQVRKSYDYYNQNSNNRGEYQQQQQHESGKIEQRMQNLRIDGSSSGTKAGSESSGGGPKKMTWATIASQPAKPQISTTNTTTKKKGPGMPPPPMVPGKHNIDLNDGWDTPKNIVPPSPPVITAPPVDLSLDKQNNANFDGQPAWPTPEQAVSQNNIQQTTPNSSNNNHSQAPPTQQQPQQHHHNLQQQQQQSSHINNNPRSNNNNNNSGGGYHHINNNPNKFDKYENNGSNYQGRQYNQNTGSNQHYNNSSSSSSNYNDYQKPYHQHPHQMPSASSHHQNQQSNSGNINNGGPITRSSMQPTQHQQQQVNQQTNSDISKQQLSDESILEQLRVKNQYNPSELDLSLVDKARFFVIKSYSEDDIHHSIKYEIWCSTEHGNKRLDQAFREREKENGVIYLFFSVNSSGHFCGVAQMITPVDYNSNSSVWSQDKWKGSFRVKWIYVKDVPNTQLRHIRLENNENKPVTNSRDTQEVPNAHGIQIMKIVHSYKHTTSIFDDFTHYEKRQEEEDSRKNEAHDSYSKMTLPASHHSSHNREYNNSGGFERGNNGNYNKYGSSNNSYNNDYKQGFNNSRGGYNKRNDFRNDRNGDQPSGFYRAKDYQDRDDFVNRSSSGGYRSDRGGSRGRGGFRSMNHN
ncbi:hypothetical protein PVAND_011697 [Polypedilum vanderplanki]|uniref:YTH domain-containing protein n=1 Tax=Polypedilum vanderplanki TaxID=319348 RepID=A0A9J6CJE4_POLVA|nr:hypothetical protein PVAND_011697 [Polypedilum vanderplanki]